VTLHSHRNGPTPSLRPQRSDWIFYGSVRKWKAHGIYFQTCLSCGWAGWASGRINAKGKLPKTLRKGEVEWFDPGSKCSSRMKEQRSPSSWS